MFFNLSLSSAHQVSAKLIHNDKYFFKKRLTLLRRWDTLTHSTESNVMKSSEYYSVLELGGEPCFFSSQYLSESEAILTLCRIFFSSVIACSALINFQKTLVSTKLLCFHNTFKAMSMFNFFAEEPARLSFFFMFSHHM